MDINIINCMLVKVQHVMHVLYTEGPRLKAAISFFVLVLGVHCIDLIGHLNVSCLVFWSTILDKCMDARKMTTYMYYQP